MKIKYIIVCLLASMGIANAQYQNYDLQTPNDAANTYIGRDYVRLLPGYSFKAATGNQMNAKVQSGLTTEVAGTFLSKTYINADWENLTMIDKGIDVGVIPITSSVSPTGAKNYNVPIDIVQGRAGFQPEISLSYNSQDGNGIVGVGWNIAGLSSIDRVDQNSYYDNKCGIIDFTTNDKFVLNGERLIQLSKTSTQIDYETSTGNTFVTAYISGETVKYFNVRYPNGIVGIFGFTTNNESKIVYPATKLTDATGNTINFTYIEDANTYYIDVIQYGGRGELGSTGFMPDFAKIDFIYYNNRIDVLSQYIVDKTVKMSKLLKKIVCYANSENYPENIYEINYSNTDNRIQNSPYTGISQLTEIFCSANGKELNSLKFICGENVSLDITKNVKTFADQSFDLTKVNVVRGKFESNIQNDGLIVYPKGNIYDIKDGNYTTVYPSQNILKVFPNIQQTNTSYPLIADEGFLGVLLANIDDSAKDEIIKINSLGLGAGGETVKFSVYSTDLPQVLSEKTFNFDNYSNYDPQTYEITESIYKKEFYTGNFTGKGIIEILCIPITIASDYTSLYLVNLEKNSNINLGVVFRKVSSDLIYTMDIDGDGQTEVLHIGSSKTDVYKYTGVKFEDIADWALTSKEFSDRQIMFADLNEDGNIDIIRSPIQNTVNVEFETRKAPAWFSDIPVIGAYTACTICNYVQKKAFKWFDSNTNSWKIDCTPNIRILKSDNRQPQVISTDRDGFLTGYVNPVMGPWIYPKVTTNNTKVLSFCPGCNAQVDYDLIECDHHHCWLCNSKTHNQFLFFGSQCCSNLTHGKSIDNSHWKNVVPVSETPVMYDNWIYQYTNGKTIIQSETIKGILRLNDYKFSIHEINGDGIPDLIYQNDAGKVVVCPFNIITRSFVMGNQTTDSIPLSFELFDVNMDDDYKNSNLLALGSNKIITIKFPYNHTRDNMVSLMVNSLGVVDKTEYTQLTDKAHYMQGTQAQFPYFDFSGPMWVVCKNSQLADKKVTSSVNYNYAGGIFHNMGLDFLGFSSLTSTNLMTNKVNSTEFDPYKQGAITKYNSDTEEINVEYSYTVAANKKTNLLPLKKIVTDKLKGNKVTVTYPLADYDSYGNSKKEIIDYGNGLMTTIEKSIDNRIGIKCFIGLLIGKLVTVERNGQNFEFGEEYQYYTNGKTHYKWDYLVADNTTRTEYIFDDVFGTLTSEIVANYLTGDQLTTSYTYWDDDKCSVHKITDPLNRVTEYSYDFTKRLLTESKDDYGKTTLYGYDDWRRLNKITLPDGTVTNITLNWNSSDDPKYLMKETTVTTGQPTTYKLTDAFGRVTRSSVAGFEAGMEVLSDKEYDSFGRLHTSTAPYKTNESRLLNTYSYDKYDRIEKIVAFNGGLTNYMYSGNTVKTKIDGVETSKTTDATGKLISSTDAGGEVTYTYRADGQPDNINASGVVTSFEYNDPFNRQTKLIDPSAGTIETQYDDARRKVKQIWNSGKSITTEFDQYGQVYANYTPDFTAVYGYEKGKFKNVTYSGNSRPMSKSNTYDEYGRIWKENEMVDGKTLEQVYLYNLGKLNSVTYMANTGSNSITYPVVYKYNTNGFLNRLEDENENLLCEINSVNAFGQETSVGFGNGLTTQTVYTPNGVLTNLKTSNIGTSYTIQNMGYDFNPINGTLNSRTDIKNSSLSESFNYGALYRLEGYGATANRQSVGYKTNGNIENKTDAGGYTYDLNGKPYTLSKISTPDNSGQKTQLDIEYTVMSRPTTISNGTYTAYIDYNDAYDRVYEEFKQGTNVLGTKHFMAGGQYEVETKAGVETQRLYLDGSPYSASVIVEKMGSAAAQPYYLHRDYLGSITQVSDKFGNLAAEYSYDAWGRMRNATNWQVYAAGTEPEIRFGRGYTGHEHLNKLGLINMNARLYDPVLGRFLAPDPLVASPDESNGYNRYMYASNNPLLYVDIDGEQSRDNGGSWLNPDGGRNNGGGNGGGYPNTNLPGSNSTGGLNMGGGFNYNGGYGGGSGGYSSGGGSYGGGYSYGASNNPLAFMFFLGNLFYTSKSERERFNVHVKSSPSAYTFKSTVRLKNVSGSGTSTVYAGGGKRQGGNNKSTWELASYWMKNHLLYEAEIRFDRGLQFDLHGKVGGIDILGGYNKRTKPIAQFEFGYKGNAYLNWYDPVLHEDKYGYNGITDPIRDKWNFGFGLGTGADYYPNNSLLGFEYWKSEYGSWGLYNLTKNYDYAGKWVETQHTIDFQLDLSLLLGIHIKFRMGYYK